MRKTVILLAMIFVFQEVDAETLEIQLSLQTQWGYVGHIYYGSAEFELDLAGYTIDSVSVSLFGDTTLGTMLCSHMRELVPVDCSFAPFSISLDKVDGSCLADGFLGACVGFHFESGCQNEILHSPVEYSCSEYHELSELNQGDLDCLLVGSNRLMLITYSHNYYPCSYCRLPTGTPAPVYHCRVCIQYSEYTPAESTSWGVIKGLYR